MAQPEDTLALLVGGTVMLVVPLVAFGIPNFPGDLDGDTDVDGYDVNAFLGCISGPGVPGDGLCDEADINGDDDVDQDDFGLVQRCISGENILADPGCTGLSPRLEDYGHSGCLPGPLSSDEYPGCGEDEIVITVEGHSLRIIHRNATYNCCPEDIRVDLTIGCAGLSLQETEILAMPCPCLCCYDIESVVVDLLPGHYWIEYCWNDWEGRQGCKTQLVPIE